MTGNKKEFIRNNVVKIFSFSGENGRSVNVESYNTSLTIEKTGEVKLYNLIEIKTTKNQWDEQSRKTFVQLRSVTIDKDQFDGIVQNYLTGNS